MDNMIGKLGVPRATAPWERPKIDWQRLATPAAALWLVATIAVGGHNADEFVHHPMDADIRDMLTWPSSATGVVDDQVIGTTIETPAPPLSGRIAWLKI